jgi:hypothetical protein
MDEPRIRSSEAYLDRMLLALASRGFVTLDPAPPAKEGGEGSGEGGAQTQEPYRVERAYPTDKLDTLLVFRSVHPLYGAFLVEQLGIADPEERVQALESVLEMPRPLLRYVRVPRPDELPPGRLARERLVAELVRRGLMLAPRPPPAEGEEEDEEEEEERPPALADKLYLLFEALHPDVHDVSVLPVWAAGELLRFKGNFNLYVRSRDLIKQEGIVFRHLLRLILLCGEFASVCPPDTTPQEWQGFLRQLSDQLTASCRAVDPTSTDEVIALAHAADVVEGESAASAAPPAPGAPAAPAPPPAEDFAAGLDLGP